MTDLCGDVLVNIFKQIDLNDIYNFILSSKYYTLVSTEIEIQKIIDIKCKEYLYERYLDIFRIKYNEEFNKLNHRKICIQYFKYIHELNSINKYLPHNNNIIQYTNQYKYFINELLSHLIEKKEYDTIRFISMTFKTTYIDDTYNIAKIKYELDCKEIFEEILLKSVINKNIEMINCLINKFYFYESYRTKFISECYKSNNWDIINVISQYEKFKHILLDKNVFMYCVKNCSDKIINYIIDNKLY